MYADPIQRLIAGQRRFFASGKTMPVEFRIQQLGKLKAAVKELEPEILAALEKDLGKSEFEAFTSEVGFVLDEISHTLRHIRDWARSRRVPTPLLHAPSESRVQPAPKGVVLIIGPWNYPFMLLISPLIGAIAAGNCAVLKPSELAPATRAVTSKLVEKTFSPEFCAVVEGAVPETSALLRERFDHIFFTGSTAVGRIVMRAAAEQLTSVTLELGGKSPCIVDADIDVAVAARRIVWGKFYNAGQTCVAPDYLLVQRGVKQDLLAAMQGAITEFYGDDPQKSPDFARIINERHYERLMGLLGEGPGQVVAGGKGDRASRYIAPTIVDGVTLKSKLMEDEIFGPILPVLAYDTLDEALAVARERPHPLACYVFTRNPKVERRVLDEVAFGGGCVNNALIHLANPNLPFGGVGTSGMGAYHGQDSFDTFSHRKAIVKTPFRMDLKLKYPPYRASALKMIRSFFMH